MISNNISMSIYRNGNYYLEEIEDIVLRQKLMLLIELQNNVNIL